MWLFWPYRHCSRINGCGGRHAHAIISPSLSPCLPLFVCSCTHCHSSTLQLQVVAGMCACPTCVVVLPMPMPALFFCACMHCCSSMWVWWQACMHMCCLPVPMPALVRPCLCTLPSLSVHLCSSPFICWSPFVPGCLCLLSCVCPHYLVVLVWLSLVLVGVHLGLFVLVQPLFALIWACLCLMDLGVRGREQIDGKKCAANWAIFGFVTVWHNVWKVFCSTYWCLQLTSLILFNILRTCMYLRTHKFWLTAPSHLVAATCTDPGMPFCEIPVGTDLGHPRVHSCSALPPSCPWPLYIFFVTGCTCISKYISY